MKKFSLIMFIIANMLVLMTLSGCRKESDVTGGWSITTTRLGVTSTDTYTFEGNTGWGVVIWEGQALGTYSIAGDIIDFTLEYLDADDNYIIEVYNGLFDGVDFMSGSFTYIAEGAPSTSGTWFGER